MMKEREKENKAIYTHAKSQAKERKRKKLVRFLVGLSLDLEFGAK